MAYRIDNLSALDWDDTALIKAYDRGMSLRVKDYEKENHSNKENFEESSKKKQHEVKDSETENYSDKENFEESSKKKQHEWKLRDYCRAVYSGDNLWYEAKIMTIDGDRCTIEFLGYNEEAEVDLDSLDMSRGKRAITNQMRNARRNLINDVDESVSGDETRNRHTAVYSPHSRHHSHSRRGYRRNDETYMFDQSNNYTDAESTSHNAYPVMRCPDMSTTMAPAVVPRCSEVVQNPSLTAVLTAWYMAGYYTGLHQVSDYEKENNTAKENFKKSSKMKWHEWKVGDYCRAVYSGDNLYYEAKISTIDGDTCTVEFLGYDEEAEVELDSLDMSRGIKAIGKQVKIARRNLISDDWRVGDHCRAVYSGDNLWYEAQIITIDGDKCTIEFLGYDEEAEVDLDSLDMSLGIKAIGKQVKRAKGNLISDDDESVSGDETRNRPTAVYSPHSRHHSHSRRGYRRNDETYMFDQSNNYTDAESTSHNAYPVMRCPDMSTTAQKSASYQNCHCRHYSF